MDFNALNATYVAWLRTELPVVEEDLATKSKRMREGVFPFMRATFFRFAERFTTLCPDLHNAPRVLAVGDVHVENFGTWRDAEGRLVWGLNDFDEAAPMPYAVDLVRLASSAALALQSLDAATGNDDIVEAIVAGYTSSLEAGGEPFVLGERHRWLRELAEGDMRDPEFFWKKLDRADLLNHVPPPAVIAAIDASSPAPHLEYRFAHRVAGLGSLGRQRFLATTTWQGARLAREAKRLCPSAWRFAGGSLAEVNDTSVHYADIVQRSVRAHDPSLLVRDGWVVRRLSPHCSKIELADLPRKHDHKRLLHAMGHELANVHMGSPNARVELRTDLTSKRQHQLARAVALMVESTDEDFARFTSISR